MTQNSIEKGAAVVVAMSGGVDSSVVAGMLKEEGFDVSGVIMRLWADEVGIEQQRKMDQAIQDASEMSELLGIPLKVVDFRKAFKETVIDYFVRAYENARTPNPCPVCNKHVKFGLLLEEMARNGAQYLATGHYARIVRSDEGYSIRKGTDERKDQSYFLYQLNQKQLSHLFFPLGDLLKSEVRAFAEERSFPVRNRPESQDLCFVADNNYRRFISQHMTEPFKEGPIVDCSGKLLGRHTGLSGYTIGQRRGIGVSAGEPLYVVGMNHEDNTLTVGNKSQRISHELIAGEVSFISGQFPDNPIPVVLKIRYAAKGIDALLTPLSGSRVHLKSEMALFDVAPGQSAVFYQGDTLLGGGTIESQNRE